MYCFFFDQLTHFVELLESLCDENKEYELTRNLLIKEMRLNAKGVRRGFINELEKELNKFILKPRLLLGFFMLGYFLCLFFKSNSLICPRKERFLNLKQGVYSQLH